MAHSCTFRPATQDDIQEILDFGNSIPEVKVSAEADFMTRDEVVCAVTNPRGIFLLAMCEEAIIGFSYANTKDPDRPPVMNHACLVYLAVRPDSRASGLGNELYERTLVELKARGINYLYAWANPTSGVIEFMQRRGWAKGHEYVWMDITL